MENNFNNRDFEQFVKQNADQYRMFPSEKVWNGIHNTLHTRKKWFGIGLALLLLTAGTVTWVMLNNSGKNAPLSYKPVTAPQNNLSEQKNNTPGVIIAAATPAKNNTHFITTADKLQNSLFLPDPAGHLTDGNNEEENTTTSVAPDIKEPIVSPVATIQSETAARNTPVYNKQHVIYKSAPIAIVNPAKNNDAVLADNKKTEVVAGGMTLQDEKKEIYPLTIESVVNSYKYHRVRKKMSWEVYFTPTVSYRKLTENKDFINSAAAGNTNPYSYTAFADINSLVTHKPDMGLQLGFNAGYPLSKSLRIIGGLQFNVSKYDIRAFFSASEVATIALNTGTGANSVSTVTNYRNFSGSKADWLRNLYFSVSAPVGLELKLTGNNKTQVGISGTIQPTLILSDRAYLISTDYKNYAEVPSLTRKWNVSTGFEIYAGYSTGKIKWRVGPEVRYQLMSSYQEKYPIKEHLFDIGLKVGIMLKK